MYKENIGRDFKTSLLKKERCVRDIIFTAAQILLLKSFIVQVFLKTRGEKEKLLVTTHHVFYLFGELFRHFHQIQNCRLQILLSFWERINMSATGRHLGNTSKTPIDCASGRYRAP